MARVPSVAKTEQTAPGLAGNVGRLAAAGRSCRNCGSSEIRPSNRRTALDILLGCLFLVPFRCRTCRKRFYRVWRRSLQDPPDVPVAPVLVMPARRKVLKADATSPRRTEVEFVEPQSIPPEPIPSLDMLASASSPPAPVDRPEGELDIPDEKQEFRALPPQPLLASIPGPAAAVPYAAVPGSILILENDLSIRKLLHRLLERRGHVVVEIERPDDLARRLRNRRAALLIVGASPTGELSLKALAALVLAYPSLKILALSTESPASAEQVHEIPGRLSVLRKPFPLDSFVDGVDLLLMPSSPPTNML